MGGPVASPGSRRAPLDAFITAAAESCSPPGTACPPKVKRSQIGTTPPLARPFPVR